ncbi:MAG: hypothetical protein QM607_13725 [Microbacterium sp.]
MRWWQRAGRAPVKPGSTARHGRHGRTGRSILTRPPVPSVDTRYERFDVAVGSASEFLRATWPELRDVRFEIAGVPEHEVDGELPRWYLDRAHDRIIIYRVPVERIGQVRRERGVAHADDMQRRLIVESVVFHAAAQWLGREPWDLAPDDFPF